MRLEGVGGGNGLEGTATIAVAGGCPGGAAQSKPTATSPAARLTHTACSAAIKAAQQAVEPLAAEVGADGKGQAAARASSAAEDPAAQTTAARLTGAATPAAASAAAGKGSWDQHRPCSTNHCSQADQSSNPCSNISCSRGGSSAPGSRGEGSKD